MADERQLKDAQIKVRIDTTDALGKLEQLRERHEDARKGGQERNAKDEKRKDNKRANEKRNVAVIPGRGLAAKAVGLFIQVKLAQFVAELGAAGIGELADTFKSIPGLSSKLEATASKLTQLSEKVESVGGIVSAGFGAASDAGAFARSQKLLKGSTNLDDVRAIGQQQLGVRSIDAQIAAARTVRGRVASKGVVVEIAANTGAELLKQFGVNR